MLATTYYTKLSNLLTPTGRDYRDLCSWRKEFKKTWRKLETREITLPINDVYRPNATKWTFTCPYFVTSRFLLCKHLIHRVHRVPTTFFKEVKGHRSVPFWRHASLKVLDDEELNEQCANLAAAEEDYDDDLPDDEEEEEFGDDVETTGGRTFNEELSDDIDLITEFLAGLEFQKQFRNQRFLNALRREGAGFFRPLAKSCVEMDRKFKRSVGTVGPWVQV
jgi:hypothetical protein